MGAAHAAKLFVVIQAIILLMALSSFADTDDASLNLHCHVSVFLTSSRFKRFSVADLLWTCRLPEKKKKGRTIFSCYKQKEMQQRFLPLQSNDDARGKLVSKTDPSRRFMTTFCHDGVQRSKDRSRKL